MPSLPEAFFGELYLESTKPFLSIDTTRAEVAFIASKLQSGLTLDLGCGHGRHLDLIQKLVPAVGLDFDQRSLLGTERTVRAQFEALPFRNAIFENVYCWYNTMGTLELPQLQRALAEVARCLKPKGLFLVSGTNRKSVEGAPEARFDAELSTGAHLLEVAIYNPERRRDEITRRLNLSDGRILSAGFFIRYYDIGEWRELLQSVGLEVAHTWGNCTGEAFGDTSTELILGAYKK
jgi:SAM-dependent methyltransferase